jgi:replicative DNA helicase
VAKPAGDPDRSLPHDEFAERAVLGAMLVDNRYIGEVLEHLSSADFYREAHQIIFSVVLRLNEARTAVDTVTVAGELEKKKELRFAGGYDYLNKLIDGIPEQISISDYIEVIRDRAKLRILIQTADSVVQRGHEPAAHTEDILENLQEEIIKLADSVIRQGFSPSQRVVPETMKLIEDIQSDRGEGIGIKSNYYELDNMTGGFQPSDLIVVAARPSMGKTAFALNVALNIAKVGKTVGFFSIEMSRVQIMMRLLAIESRIGMAAIRTGRPHFTPKEWSDLELAAQRLEQTKFYIDDSASLSIIEMKTRARRLHKDVGLDVVFVDYLQLMKVTGENLRRSDSRAQEVAVISASLKELAKELNIPVVALAQLNRSPEQRGGKGDMGPKYQLSDLKESGAIEQDADVIMFLHREDQVNKETERKGEADLIVAKQRNGPTGKIVLAFQDRYTKFVNYEHSSMGEAAF